MPFDIASQHEIQIVRLDGAVTIRNALELAARLVEGLEYGRPIKVDTGGLEDIDTCVLQLLCSLRKKAGSLSFDNPSEVFVNAVDRCGLRRELFGTREGL